MVVRKGREKKKTIFSSTFRSKIAKVGKNSKSILSSTTHDKMEMMFSQQKKRGWSYLMFWSVLLVTNAFASAFPASGPRPLP